MLMTFDEVKQLVEWMCEAGVSNFVLSEDQLAVKFSQPDKSSAYGEDELFSPEDDGTY